MIEGGWRGIGELSWRDVGEEVCLGRGRVREDMAGDKYVFN